MPFVEKVEARAYSRATEVVDRVKRAVFTLFPESLWDKVNISTTKTEGHGQVPIHVVIASIKGKKQAQTTFSSLVDRLEEADRRWLAASIDQRLDEKCVLYLRVDKQDAFNGDIHIAKGPDVIRVKVYLREYPRCDRQKTIEYVRNTLARVERE